MKGKKLVQVFVLIRFIGHYLALGLDLSAQDRNDAGNGGAIDVEATGFAAATNESQHGVLVSEPGFRLGLAFKATDKGFVGFDDLAFAAHGLYAGDAHGLTDAMRNEPCSLEGATEGAVKLIAADALL